MDDSMNVLDRTMMTIGCRDSESIPKVPNAGEIITYKNSLVQVMHNGVLVEAGGYYGDWIAHIIRGLRGHHEPQEELIFYWLLKYIRHNSRIIELGCFWSYYSLWYLSEIPGSYAIGIEPDIKHLELGIRNAAINNLSNRIEFINAWVGGAESDMFSATTENSNGPISLPMINMSFLEKKLKGHDIELIHIDTQGAELDFIRSMRDINKTTLRFLMVSTHHSSISGSKTTHWDCIDELRSQGGVILVEHDVVESYSGDGLILASFYQNDQNLFFPEISRNKAETSLFKNY